jgi:hypothetical protein
VRKRGLSLETEDKISEKKTVCAGHRETENHRSGKDKAGDLRMGFPAAEIEARIYGKMI